MARELYAKAGFVSTLLEGKVIHVIWEKLFDAQTIYDSCEAQLKAVKAGEAEVVIIDISNAKGTPPQECQDWFGNTLFPAFSENKSFKGLINVLPKEVFAKLGADRWKKTAESGAFGFSIYESDSPESAKNLAATM